MPQNMMRIRANAMKGKFIIRKRERERDERTNEWTKKNEQVLQIVWAFVPGHKCIFMIFAWIVMSCWNFTENDAIQKNVKYSEMLFDDAVYKYTILYYAMLQYIDRTNQRSIFSYAWTVRKYQTDAVWVYCIALKFIFVRNVRVCACIDKPLVMFVWNEQNTHIFVS